MHRFYTVCSALIWLALVAFPNDAATANERVTEEGAAAHQEIVTLLQDVQRKYGSDAVMLEGHLLGYAVRNGSIIEAEISVPGIEERAGKRFLAFKLDTGIIYNDRELSAATRPARLWREVVEAALRQFHTMSMPADGIVLRVGYGHKDYVDEVDLRAHLHEGHGEPEAAAFYLLLGDIGELIADRIDGQQLIDRSTVLVNQAPLHVALEAPTPTPPP